MVYKFRIISNENEKFFRDIEIKKSSTFFEFHQIIQVSVNFDKTQIASFFISNNKWEKKEEITLMDMSDFDKSKAHVMHKTKMSDFVKQKNDKLIYIYDFFSEREFYIELMNISKPENKIKYPVLANGKGKAPKQILGENIPMPDFQEDFEDDIHLESLDYLGEDL